MLLGVGGRQWRVGAGPRPIVLKTATRARPTTWMLTYGYGDHVARRIDCTSLLPVLIAPKILHRSEPRCDDMVRYTELASEGLAHHFARRER